MIQVDLSQLMDEAKAKKRSLYSATSNYASMLGDPCIRYLVYMRTHGTERPLYDVNLQYIFDEGKLHEKALIRELQDLGFEIRAQQKGWPPNPQNISGRMEGEIKLDGHYLPFEVKSISPYEFIKLPDNIMDFLKSKKRWLRRYPAQLNLYLYMNNQEEGIFLFKNKLTGKIKQINVRLDYEYTESLLKKAEEIEKHIKEGTLPDRIEEDSLHEGCDFYHICLPDTIHEGSIIDDPELEEKLNRRKELKVFTDEYKELDEEIKERFKNVPEAMIGNWLIKGTLREKKPYSYPGGQYWETRIKELK